MSIHVDPAADSRLAAPVARPDSRPDHPAVPCKVVLGGTEVDLSTFEGAVDRIIAAAGEPRERPLAVASANLDHVFHFGTSGRWHGLLENSGNLDWLTLLDGAPLRAKATALTGHDWPRLAGSDLIDPLLDRAREEGLSVGFLGGSEATHALLKEQFARHRPDLQVSGWWAPERPILADRDSSEELAAEIAASGTDMLVVGLGKPRQELWMSEYGALTGAPVLLAFGAVVDFLAGRIQRAPQAVADAGMEWAWRLAMEPQRLARRYLVQGPEAYLRMNRHSSVDGAPRTAPLPVQPPARAAETPEGAFTPSDFLADVTVVLVTYNNEADIDPLLEGLRGETGSQSLKVVVADNGSSDGTCEKLAAHPDVILAETGGNVGYAGGINAALRQAGPHHDVLVLNPDLRILPGAVRTLRRRMRVSGAGIVVPRLLDADGTTYTSLRREPTLGKAVGDALFGGKLAGRPEWLSEIDYNAESYQFPHPIEWATGAAVLISGTVAGHVGDWDEQFFLYSEETDYFRRAREHGHTAWFEPSASMVHSRGGSGASADLAALMAVNRVRYAATHHSRGYAALVRSVGATAELARSYKAGNRRAFMALAGMRDWKSLPHASSAPAPAAAVGEFPSGAVIIPAHNEAAVIARTLRPLAALAASGAVEVIVACNGCTDNTAAIAASFPGVIVLDFKTPSKTAALNAADVACTRWPRLYLDADIEVAPDAVADVFRHLGKPGALAARPSFRYETSGADRLVKAYYRARLRIPAMSEHLWGAGAYAVSLAGHARFGHFPAATADDAFVDSLFKPSEKAVLPTRPVVVRVPLHTRELYRTLRRIYRGNQQLALNTASGDAMPAVPAAAQPAGGTGLGKLLRSVTGPAALVDAGIYASLALAGKATRSRSLTLGGGWDRDESSRTA
ncbi:exopolysaccharide biosynthesis WecB/TagA/CpsF family protein [Arthrobacter stackebrandtii]|uniref:Exopolysaccharide biosynthesis WecB/TagA/CpsF family protein n=1 Tax=Arthrobacter stackebrandtii TaxID=272161 RepID=A0ABS4YRX3_9MICC|nr:exopolysaccharide biosynthesis WecB/TagA/CpsF family protein [Arthrobacter stackebrandtii]